MPKNEKLDNKRHSLAHLMAAIILEIFPEAKFGVGPVVEDGVYYDVHLKRALTPEDLQVIEKRMREKVKQNLRFERSEMPIDSASEMFRKMSQDFKVELLHDLKTRGTTAVADLDDPNLVGSNVSEVSVYKTGPFIDLCRGPHVAATSEIDPESFRLTRISGAYWRQSGARANAAGLWGRLQYEAGTGRLFRAIGRSPKARSPQTWPGTRPVYVSSVGAGSGFLAAQRNDVV